MIALKNCTNDEGDHYIDLQSYGISSALNYSCENNGNRIFSKYVACYVMNRLCAESSHVNFVCNFIIRIRY